MMAHVVATSTPHPRVHATTPRQAAAGAPAILNPSLSHTGMVATQLSSIEGRRTQTVHTADNNQISTPAVVKSVRRGLVVPRVVGGKGRGEQERFEQQRVQRCLEKVVSITLPIWRSRRFNLSQGDVAGCPDFRRIWQRERWRRSVIYHRCTGVSLDMAGPKL